MLGKVRWPSLAQFFFLRMCSRFFLLDSSLYTDDATASHSCRRSFVVMGRKKNQLNSCPSFQLLPHLPGEPKKLKKNGFGELLETWWKRN